MVDITAVSGLLTSLQALKELVSSISATHDRVRLDNTLIAVNEAIMSAHEKAIAAQEAYSTLDKTRCDLEKRVREFETWEREAQRYELKDFGGSTFAYVVKEAMQGSEPPHSICPTCYENKKKSILQFVGIKHSQQYFLCPVCDRTYHLGEYHYQKPVSRIRPPRQW
jgi:hypothetical protein